MTDAVLVGAERPAEPLLGLHHGSGPLHPHRDLDPYRDRLVAVQRGRELCQIADSRLGKAVEVVYAGALNDSRHPDLSLSVNVRPQHQISRRGRRTTYRLGNRMQISHRRRDNVRSEARAARRPGDRLRLKILWPRRRLELDRSRSNQKCSSIDRLHRQSVYDFGRPANIHPNPRLSVGSIAGACDRHRMGPGRNIRESVSAVSRRERTDSSAFDEDLSVR